MTTMSIFRVSWKRVTIGLAAEFLLKNLWPVLPSLALAVWSLSPFFVHNQMFLNNFFPYHSIAVFVPSLPPSAPAASFAANNGAQKKMFKNIWKDMDSFIVVVIHIYCKWVSDFLSINAIDKRKRISAEGWANNCATDKRIYINLYE